MFASYLKYQISLPNRLSGINIFVVVIFLSPFTASDRETFSDARMFTCSCIKYAL